MTWVASHIPHQSLVMIDSIGRISFRARSWFELSVAIPFCLKSSSMFILKGIINMKHGQDACNVRDKGGFAPNVWDNREGLVLLMDVIKMAGYAGKVEESLLFLFFWFSCTNYRSEFYAA